MSTDARADERGREQHSRAEMSRALAAEHRARAHELRAGAAGDDERTNSDAFLQAGIAEMLAQIADLRAAGLEERSAADDLFARADTAAAGEREDLLSQAAEASQRADALEQEAADLQRTLEPEAGAESA